MQNSAEALGDPLDIDLAMHITFVLVFSIGSETISKTISIPLGGTIQNQTPVITVVLIISLTPVTVSYSVHVAISVVAISV